MVMVLVPWRDAVGRSASLVPDDRQKPPVEYLRYFYIPRVARFTYAIGVLFSLLGKVSALKKRKLDCLLLSWAYPDGVAGMVLAKLLGLPAVIKIHGSDVNMHMSHRLRAVQIAWAMRSAGGVISVSEALADKLVAKGISRSKIKVIYNGLDHGLFRPLSAQDCRSKLKLGESRQRLLYIGNLKREKGCVELMESFLRLSVGRPDLDLVYIGAGKEESTISELATAAGVDSRVHLRGVVDHQQLPEWINACDLVVLPSYSEGVPNVLLEAMACGTPVVATSVGGIPEVVPEHAGILIAPQDVDGLTAALSTALDKRWDPSLIAGAAARYNWDANAEEVESFLADVVASHQR
jgi:glycosyltransferase involved in cell wall biosynthesis